ncbi:sigma-70 family RNA polymerase sigma factor [bacterium]|nr:sigma-70 family RNA polymerase sigma factor [bacterium]
MNEKDLVKKVKEGDVGAFELLVRLHHQAVYHMAFRYMKDHGSADDVVQDSFLKAYKAIGSFKGDSSFKSWVMRIAINTSKNAIRARSRHQGADVETQVLATVHEDFSRMEKGQTVEILKEAIDKLPAKQREALELRIFEEMSFKEVAEAMDSPFDTAKANFRHALMNLRKILEQADAGRDIEEIRKAYEAWNEDY